MRHQRLESVVVEGFTSIRSAALTLRDLNVLVGANGAGKSNSPSARPAARLSRAASKWAKLEPELRRLLGDSSTDVLTTMFDYYAFPADAPGVADRPSGFAMLERRPSGSG